jgi:hypothetical protein
MMSLSLLFLQNREDVSAVIGIGRSFVKANP